MGFFELAQSDLRLYRTLERILESEELNDHLHSELYMHMKLSELNDRVAMHINLTESLKRMGGNNE